MPIVCWGNLAKSADDTQRIEQAIQEYVAGHDENPNSHMGADYSLGSHRLQNVLDHPYGSIKYYHVYDIHADAITAGALVIKGGGPYMVVQDGAGAERVKIYPEGIIVKQGRIIVQNDQDVQIIDGKGLVGSNIFYSGQTELANEEIIKGWSIWYPVPNLAFGIYLFRPTPVLVFGNAPFFFQGFENQIHFRIEYSGGYQPDASGWTFWAGTSYERFYTTLSFTRILLLNAGFSLVRLQMSTDSNNYFNGISTGDQSSNFGYVVLGN